MNQSFPLRTALTEWERLLPQSSGPLSQTRDRLFDEATLWRRVQRDAAATSLWLDTAGGQLAQLAKYVRETPLPHVETHDKDQLHVDGERVDPLEIEPALKEYGAAHTQESALAILLSWLGKSKPAARAILLYILLPYIISIIANLHTPLYEEWWKQFQSTDPRAAKKEIVAVAKTSYRIEDLREYRFVISKILAVRNSPKQRGIEVDRLNLGKTIKLLKWERDWSLIEYSNGTESDLKQGWVLSRYLERFR